MQLKSLEIHGFKSFGDKTKFLFDEGITGVVGPNGCGKSNIVDSIRWVLGEQKTRKLRSEKMENIIFAGTSKRKRANFAQVTLTFENTKNILPTEYSTVAVSRKLYRSGDSEYSINDIPCRLKDVHNLFLDTGVGSDSYAIIELKMVDEILNDKENSRRLLFEEAAGISKYKIRKKETLRKLKGTQDDLERVQDILYEIQKQLKSLENQARKARRYFEIKEEYKLLSSQHAFFTIRSLRESYEAVEKEEKAFEDKLLGMQSAIAQKEARAMELRKEQIENETRLAEAQKDLNAHTATIQEIEKEKSIQNERLKYLQQREISIRNQMEQDRKTVTRLDEDILRVRDMLEKVKKESAELEAGLASQKAAHEEVRELHDELKFKVDGLSEAFRKDEAELNALTKEKEIKLIQVESLSKEIERNEADKSTKSEELDAFAERLATLKVETSTLEAEVTQLREQKAANDAAIEASSHAINELKDAIYKVNRGIDSRQNEYNLTKSLVENLEGFPESVKYLKREANWVKDAPLLSDIFTTEERYKVAFENFLDPYMSYYVVDERAHAMQAIQLLAKASKGRANFFILEELESYEPHPRHDWPGCQPAVDIVDVADKYRQLAAYLLDRVYIADTVQSIPDDAPAHIQFVTQTGDLMRKRFSIGGGSIGLFQGKRLGRAKNLEKLSKEIRQLEKELNEQKTALDQEEKKLASLRSNEYGKELETKNGEFQAKRRELSVLEAREQESREFIARAGERSEVIEKQIQELEETITRITPQIAEMQAHHGEQAAILEESRRQLDNAAAELSEKRQAYNEQNIACIQKRNQLDMLDREEKQKAEELERLALSEKQNAKDLAETKQNIHDLVDDNLKNDTEMVALYDEKKVKEQQTDRLEQLTGQMRQNILTVEEEIRAKRKEKEALEQGKGEVREKVTDIKIQLNSLKERMQVEFQIDISDLDEEELFEGGVEKFSHEDVTLTMQKVREKLQKYGEINPMAVEAFDEMKERHDFIQEQKEDLENARKTLLDTIEEIDETATTRFMEAFDQIRTNFKQVFQHLFYEGDTCDLVLLEEGDALESPIDITAKPKGKRPQSINQLSGGEKTLTAVALLFAIYLLKPAPFCIFDEVDAPLDDANIDKFNNIIREFSKDSQFIIVTHNKRTMAATNVMYGVTMQESGVSMVLPVDLQSLNLD